MADIDDLITNLNKLSRNIKENTSTMKTFLGYQQEQAATSAAGGLSPRQKQDVKNEKDKNKQIGDSAKKTLSDYEDLSKGVTGKLAEAMNSGLAGIRDQINLAKDGLNVLDHITDEYGNTSTKRRGEDRRSTDLLRDNLLEGMNQFVITTDKTLQVQGMNLTRVYENHSDVIKDFQKMMLDNTDIADKMMKDMNSTQMAQVGLYQKALGTSASDTAYFVNRQLALTGKASNEMLDNFAAAVKSASAQSGIAQKLITRHAMEMAKAVDDFGNMSVKSMAGVSVQLHQLGLDFKNFSGMVKGFQTFDTAAEKVGNLTTVFGVHLDAMELMRQANEDQGMMLQTVRESFMDQGIAVDELSLAQKDLLKSQLGLADIESVEKLFSDQFEMGDIDEITAGLAEGGGGKGLEAVHEDITLVREEFSSMEQIANRTGDLIKKSVALNMVPALDKLDKSMSKVVSQGNKVASSLGAGLGKDMQKTIDAVANKDWDKISGGMEKMFGGMAKGMKNLKKGDFKGAVDEMVKILNKSNLGGVIVDGFTIGASKIKEIFTQLFGKGGSVQKMISKHWKPKSVPEGWEDFVKGVDVVKEVSSNSLKGISTNFKGSTLEILGDLQNASSVAGKDNFKLFEDLNKQLKKQKIDLTKLDAQETAQLQKQLGISSSQLDIMKKLKDVKKMRAETAQAKISLDTLKELKASYSKGLKPGEDWMKGAEKSGEFQNVAKDLGMTAELLKEKLAAKGEGGLEQTFGQSVSSLEKSVMSGIKAKAMGVEKKAELEKEKKTTKAGLDARSRRAIDKLVENSSKQNENYAALIAKMSDVMTAVEKFSKGRAQVDINIPDSKNLFNAVIDYGVDTGSPIARKDNETGGTK